MSQITSKLTYQINLPKSLEIKDHYYSPIFSTNNKMFWQLSLHLEDNDSYGLYLQPVASPDEITWRERSKLSFKIFVKEIRNNNHTAELYNRSFVVPPDTRIEYDHGYPDVIKKSSLRNGELIIGVIVKNIEYNESDICKTYYSELIPKNLINAWKDQLFDFRSVDVEFDVQGEKFYAYSSILSKRSEYFAKILSGHWSESTTFLDQNESCINCGVKLINTSNDPNINLDGKNDVNDNKSIYQIKHHIKISEYDPIIISTMLEYLYTNQIKWINEDDESVATELFRLADQYLLSDLRERAKIRILDELKISNVSKIMFNLVPRYEDLKEPVLNFMAKNFEQVNNSQEFKDILANLVDYPNYNVILSEILTEHFKIQKTQ